MPQYPENKLDIRKIARSQGKSARAESGLAEEEVALATSIEGRPLSAEVSWSGDGGALRKSSKGGRMFKALLLSSFIISVTAMTNLGYELLLKSVDAFVLSSYGNLSNNPDPELKATGQEITKGYFSYR